MGSWTEVSKTHIQSSIWNDMEERRNDLRNIENFLPQYNVSKIDKGQRHVYGSQSMCYVDVLKYIHNIPIIFMVLPFSRYAALTKSFTV